MANSKWVTGTIGDIAGVQEILDTIDTGVGYMNTGIDFAVVVINIAVIVAEITIELIGGAQSADEVAKRATIKGLEISVDLLVDIIKQVLDFGIYALPQHEAFPFKIAFEDAILDPGFDSRSLGADTQVKRVPDKDNPSNYHYEKVNRRIRTKATGYQQFINDVVNSFTDSGDKNRPEFGPKTKLSGVSLVVASENLMVFCILYLILTVIIDKDGVINKAKGLAELMKETVRLGEGTGRLPYEAKQGWASFWEAIEEATGINNLKQQVWPDLVRALSDLLPDDILTGTGDPDGVPKIISVRQEKSPIDTGIDLFVDNVSGEISSTAGAVPGTAINTNYSFSPNYVNKSTFTIVTNGKGVLTATYFMGGKKITNIVGVGKEEYTVSIPLFPMEGRKDSFTGQIQKTGDVYYVNNGINNLTNSPTYIKFSLDQVDGDINGKFSYILPAFNKLPDGKDIQDGYRHNIKLEIKPSSGQITDIATDLGISVEELDFPKVIRIRDFDFSEYGSKFEKMDIDVTVTPQVEINTDFTGSLIVNGTEYEYFNRRTGLRNVVFTFKDIPIQNKVRQQNLIVFVSQTPTANGTIYSQPEVFNMLTAGGRLQAPKITSGRKINVSENILNWKDSKFGEQVNFGDYSGNTGLSGNFLNNTLNKSFGDPKKGDLGSRTTEETQVNALYQLKGKKSQNTTVYAIIESPDGDVSLQVVGNTRLAEISKEFSDLSFIAFGANRFSSGIILPWGDKSESDSITYKFRVYQTDNQNIVPLIAQAQSKPDKEKWLLGRINRHQSEAARIDVKVENISAESLSTPPNWENYSLSAIFPIADAIEEVLNDFVETLKESLPKGPYEEMKEWVKVQKEKIEKLIKKIRKLQAIINAIVDLLKLGGSTGFYFLGIDGANGVEGFQQRIRAVSAPDKLAKAKYVTGIQIVVPGEIEDPITGASVPAGSLLMSTIFSKLPSDGQDNVKVPEDSGLDKFEELYETTKKQFENQYKSLKEKFLSIDNMIEESLTDSLTKFEEID